ncbi:MAG: TGS domain-containing protein [Porphyromonas sp.]|nr:TGS domain-containing protein [Porphyromonas sp.]
MKRGYKLDELNDVGELLRSLLRTEHGLTSDEVHLLLERLRGFEEQGLYEKDDFGMDALTRSLLTAHVVVEEIGLEGCGVLTAVLLQKPVHKGVISLEQVRKDFGDDAAVLLELLLKVGKLYERDHIVTSENFSHFLLSFAEDVRVILILIGDRLVNLRLAGKFLDEQARIDLSMEASYLYAPLAHRLGLYNIKSEMEDLCLKYTDRETYDFIKVKLSQTKKSRDRYIASFITPIEEKLREAGLKFEIKGRTKSISSIRNKLKKQNIEFEAIYDLFAIRIILDVPLKKEREQCWRVYSVITDMYQPNPKRLKDWISVPKSNGYESLHITVMGPENRWVEVQIRSERMDEIAEKGLAAHWRYKGIKSERGLDEFMTEVREALEQKDKSSEDVISDFKLSLYDEEIYVFTPKGDLIKLPKGATVLDFAFAIHTNVGCKTVSARVNDRNVGIRHTLQNGDTVRINTSSTQEPKADWLNIVVTSKAKSKIKQLLRAQSQAKVDLVREEIQRRMRNRKLDYDEAIFTRLIKRKGYKATTNFYLDVSAGHTELGALLDEYKAELDKQVSGSDEAEHLSADSFITTTVPEQIVNEGPEVLVIDSGLTGIEYELAKCCNPIFGDKVFAYPSKNGIKIHRMDCPNAPELFREYGHKVLKAQWAGEKQDGYEVLVRIVGNDDIAVANNITSQISKSSNITLRRYNIESLDGLFQGYFYLYVQSLGALNTLISKLRTTKGVKQVDRIDQIGE